MNSFILDEYSVLETSEHIDQFPCLLWDNKHLETFQWVFWILTFRPIFLIKVKQGTSIPIFHAEYIFLYRQSGLV